MKLLYEMSLNPRNKKVCHLIQKLNRKRVIKSLKSIGIFNDYGINIRKRDPSNPHITSYYAQSTVREKVASDKGTYTLLPSFKIESGTSPLSKLLLRKLSTQKAI